MIALIVEGKDILEPTTFLDIALLENWRRSWLALGKARCMGGMCQCANYDHLKRACAYMRLLIVSLDEYDELNA